MTAALKNEISARQAQKLWALLRQHFINFERTLEEIIEKRAWEPMGYESFPEAWTAQMGDITLAAEFRPHVVYAYFDQGASVADVAAGVKGVGPERAAALKRQRNHGVPADAASMSTGRKWHNRNEDTTVVREHERKKPAEASTVHIALSALKYKRYQKIAKKVGVPLEDLCRDAIDEKFAALT
jgi:hypothetical protein